MAATLETGISVGPQDFTAGRRDGRVTRPDGGGWPGLGWQVVGLTAVALVVLGGIYILPDFLRYMKMRSM